MKNKNLFIGFFFMIPIVVVTVFFVSKANAVETAMVESLIENEYQGGGVKQPWTGDDSEWDYTLPFTFNFYGTGYTDVKIGSNGVICFDALAGDCEWFPESIDENFGGPFIVPMGTDLVVDSSSGNPTNGIYITENSDNVVIRWDSVEYGEVDQVYFEAILYESGDIKFNYGDQDQSILTYNAVVGISSGDGTNYTASSYNDTDSFDLIQTSSWHSQLLISATGFSPEDDSTDVSAGSNLSVTFEEDVFKGTGNIVIKDSSDDSTIESFNVSSSDKITGWGTNTITINPTNDFSLNDEVYVNIDNTAVKNIDDVYYPGISNDSTWNFSLESSISVEEIQITNDPDNAQYYPSIHDNKIVWQDYRNAVVGGVEEPTTHIDLYMYDIDTQIETQITNDEANQYYPKIHGNKIVWQDDRNGGWSASDIYMYDLETEAETRITNNSSNQAYPAIYGNKIVWQDYRYDSYGDIFMHDIETGTETRITNNSYAQTDPEIHGNKIVWKDDRNGASNSDIYMYNIDTEEEVQITTNTSGQYSPVIYGNKIVWRDYRNGSADIYMYDLETEVETRITPETRDRSDLSIHGDFVVWQERVGSDTNIYMYDIESQNTKQITTNVSGQYHPDIFEDKIVWDDLRSGTADIFMGDLTIKSDASHYQFSDGFDGDQHKDSSETTASWDIDRGVVTIDSVWTHADEETEGVESLVDDIPLANYQYSIWTKTKMVVDSNDNPMVVWLADNGVDYSVRFATWNGDNWVGMDGSANYEEIGTTTWINHVDMVLDDNDNPQVVWAVDNDGVYYTKWNGSDWTYADEVTSGFELISETFEYDWAGMALLKADNNGEPIVGWVAEDNNLHLVRWNGSDWTNADQSTSGIETLGPCSTFDFELDSSNNPIVVYEGNNGVLFTKWNGSNWTYADNSTLGEELISDSSGAPEEPNVILDDSDIPYVVWDLYTSPYENSGFSQWNGTDWVNADDTTPGYETIPLVIDSDIILDYQGNPVIYGEDDDTYYYSMTRWNGSDWTEADGTTSGTDSFAEQQGGENKGMRMIANPDEDEFYFLWSSAQAFSTHFTMWNGDDWTSASGETLGDESLSGDYYTFHSSLEMSSDYSKIYTSWFQDTSDDDGIRFAMYDFNQTLSATVQSIEIDETDENIISATLTADDSTPGDSNIIYYLSNDGGVTWEEVESGVEHTFLSIGNDLRWRAILTRGSVPVIESIDVVYGVGSVEEPGDPEDPSDPEDPEDPSDPEDPDNPEEDEEEHEAKAKELEENCSSMTITVSTDFDDEDLDFKVEVKNIDTGEESTLKLDDIETNSSGRAKLTLESLSENTNYKIKVKYKDPDTDEYTDWSSSKEIKTSFCNVPITEQPIPEEPTPTPEPTPEPYDYPESDPEPTKKPESRPKTEDEPEAEEEKEFPMKAAATAAALIGGGGVVTGAWFGRRRLAMLFGFTWMKKRNWRVFDVETGDAIEGALVSLESPEGEIIEEEATDEKGHFKFKASPGNNTIKVDKEGYQMIEQQEKEIIEEYGEIYTGGSLNNNRDVSLNINIPMKKIKRAI